MRIIQCVACLIAVAVAAAGCGRVSDGANQGGASQRVTGAFGARPLADTHIRAGATALAALRAGTTVETSFGGKFVAAMHGLKSDRTGRRDWFFFVNGLAPNHGADEQTVRPGDRIWWDYRPWGGGPSVPAVVGSWPEPFVHGYPDAPGGVQADPPLDDPLRAAGARVAPAPSRWRVIVGASDDLVRRDAAWRSAIADPRAAGLTVTIDATHIGRLAADGHTFVTVPQGRAVAALILTGQQSEAGGAVMVVAGRDGAAATAAANRIARTPEVLQGRYAVVFDGAGNPVAAAGRDLP